MSFLDKFATTTGDGFTKLYDKFHTSWSSKFKKTFRCLCYILSITWWAAYVAHKGLGKSDRKKAIIARNYFYLSISITYCIVLGLILPYDVFKNNLTIKLIVFSLLYFLTCSRCNEILFAFITDALEKTSGNENKSSLTYRKRIELSLLSYIELILNYALIYYFMPKPWFDITDTCLKNIDKCTSSFHNIFDSIYFSAVTITTIGYGDFTPKSIVPKFMIIHEVFVGLTLLVVSFAIYAGKGLSNEKSNLSASEKIRALKRNKKY